MPPTRSQRRWSARQRPAPGRFSCFPHDNRRYYGRHKIEQRDLVIAPVVELSGAGPLDADPPIFIASGAIEVLASFALLSACIPKVALRFTLFASGTADVAVLEIAPSLTVFAPRRAEVLPGFTVLLSGLAHGP